MIYRYKATIPESKVFFRIYDVESDMTLYDFQKFILDNLDFSPDQMACFEACGPSGKVTARYAIFDLGDGAMDNVTFADTVAKEENIIDYVFDLRSGRYIHLEFLGEGEYSYKLDYPNLVDAKGVNPDQFSAKYEDAEPASFKPSRKSSSVDDEDFEDDEDFDDDDEDIDDEEEDGDEEELLVDEDFGK